MGIRYALDIMQNLSYLIPIKIIEGTHDYTNPTVVAVAAMNALWKAFEYQPSPVLWAAIEQEKVTTNANPLDGMPSCE